MDWDLGNGVLVGIESFPVPVPMHLYETGAGTLGFEFLADGLAHGM